MNIICIGAHPDDAEFYAGGTLLKWVRAGHAVLVVSMTNGDIGHFAASGPELAARRAEEMTEAAERGGYDHLMLDCHDGELLPTLERRREVVKLIREHQAEVVLTHRPVDYHPDHRYTSTLVQDAAFMVTVPNFSPEAQALRTNPLFLYMMDRFSRPVPFQVDAAVAVDDVMEEKWGLLDAMPSQFYEWLPWLEGKLEQVPPEGPGRGPWLREAWSPLHQSFTEVGRPALIARYGEEQGKSVQFAELFEVCPYGRQPAQSELLDLLPR